MKLGEENAASKSSRAASSVSDAAIASYQDWSNSIKAYYCGNPPHNSYIFGGQQHALAPHCNQFPILYPAVYPHRTNSQWVSLRNKAPIENESNAKQIKIKLVENGKTTSDSGNGAVSLSGDVGSQGSSNGGEDNSKQENRNANKRGSMDLWSTYQPGTAMGTRKVRSNPSNVSPYVMPDRWIHDERELKREKRKQSNRESARRSRLRKQAECEDLQARVQNLGKENDELQDELKRLSAECAKLRAENESIKEEVTRVRGADALANLGTGIVD